MIKKILIILVFLTVAIAWGYNFTHRQPPCEDLGKEALLLRKVFPEADSFSAKMSVPSHYQAYKGEKRQLVGYCFNTFDLVPQIKGYAGPLQIMVGIDLEGKIQGVEILSLQETPGYFRPERIPWFIRQFKGKGKKDPLQIGKDLEGITQATISCQVIARAIKESLQIMAGGGAEEVEFTKKIVIGGKEKLDLFVLGGLVFLALIALFNKKRWLRWGVLVLGLAFLGFYKSSPLSLLNIVNLLTGRLPPLSWGLFFYVLLFIIVITSLLLGPLYCGWLCPFGNLQELIHLRKVKPYSLPPGLLGLKYPILWAVLVAALLLDKPGIANFEPFATLFNRSGNKLQVMFLSAVLLGSLFYDRFWCRYFCPVGIILRLLAKLRLSRLSLWGKK